MIFNVLTEEEDKFNKTIDQGLSILNDMEYRTECKKVRQPVIGRECI